MKESRSYTHELIETAEHHPKKVVLTGGPCAGKTSILEQLKHEDEFKDSFVVVSEAATMLLPGFLAVRSELDDSASEWQYSFQESVTHLQLKLEQQYVRHATIHNIPLVLCDRGLLDAYAYTDGAADLLESITGCDFQGQLDQYDAVLHLESLATANPSHFSNSNNIVRYESEVAQAAYLELKTRQAWEGHKAFRFIEGDNLKSKYDTVRSVIRKLIMQATA